LSSKPDPDPNLNPKPDPEIIISDPQPCSHCKFSLEVVTTYVHCIALINTEAHTSLSAQSHNLSSVDCSSCESSSVSTFLKLFVLYANLVIILCLTAQSSASSIKIVNRHGSRTVPCGTPDQLRLPLTFHHLLTLSVSSLLASPLSSSLLLRLISLPPFFSIAYYEVGTYFTESFGKV
jgi:hypothetical protein